MNYSAIRNLVICVLSVLAFALTTVAANSESGNVEQGEVVYIKRCLQCHGEEGMVWGRPPNALTRHRVILRLDCSNSRPLLLMKIFPMIRICCG